MTAARYQNGRWDLNLEHLFDNWRLFDNVDSLNNYISQYEMPVGYYELVLFIRAPVTENKFLMVGKDRVAERNFLSGVLGRREKERRLFFS